MARRPFIDAEFLPSPNRGIGKPCGFCGRHCGELTKAERAELPPVAPRRFRLVADFGASKGRQEMAATDARPAAAASGVPSPSARPPLRLLGFLAAALPLFSGASLRRSGR